MIFEMVCVMALRSLKLHRHRLQLFDSFPNYKSDKFGFRSLFRSYYSIFWISAFEMSFKSIALHLIKASLRVYHHVLEGKKFFSDSFVGGVDYPIETVLQFFFVLL